MSDKREDQYGGVLTTRMEEVHEYLFDLMVADGQEVATATRTLAAYISYWKARGLAHE